MAIGLGVVCFVEIQLGTLNLKQLLLEIASEVRVRIGHNGLRHVVEF